MSTMNDVNLMAMLDCFGHWTVQAHNSNGRRRYDCTIRNDHHIYRASRRSPADAIRAAIAKVKEGPPKRRKPPRELTPERPVMRLVTE